MGKLKPINPTKAQIVANPQAAAHDYDNLTHKPQINGHELVGNKSSDDLGLQGKLTAGENVTIDENDGTISAEGGVTSYIDLDNKPQINGHELVDNRTAIDLGLQKKLWTSGISVTLSNDGIIDLSNRVFEAYYDTYYTSDYDFNRVDMIFWHAGTYTFPVSRLANVPPAFSDMNDEITVFHYMVQPNVVDKSLIRFVSYKTAEDNHRLFAQNAKIKRSRQDDSYADVVNASDWLDLGANTEISSAAVNQNGTITFTMSDGSTVTTTGESVIGPQGDAYVLTAQDKSDIAAIVLSELPTTQGVQYGNSND